jgi:hypothetical protein
MTSNSPLEPAVVLVIFNRADTTAGVLEAIRSFEPPRLMVVADGPRPGCPDDERRCAAARAVVAGVDWDCRVVTNYAETHMGLRRRVDSGLDWVFAQADAAIVLEDDCVPDPSFFPFCVELLERYQDDARVMGISAGNFQPAGAAGTRSYHFSRYPLPWGWATWRRAWQRYEPAMRRWPELEAAGWLDTVLETPAARRYWRYTFRENHRTGENWDFAWTYSCWLHGGLTITPSVNLVTNIGHRLDATHTTDAASRFANLRKSAMAFPLQHPPAVERDAEADALTERIRFSGEYFVNPLFRAIRSSLRARAPR